MHSLFFKDFTVERQRPARTFFQVQVRPLAHSRGPFHRSISWAKDGITIVLLKMLLWIYHDKHKYIIYIRIYYRCRNIIYVIICDYVYNRITMMLDFYDQAYQNPIGGSSHESRDVASQ